MAKFDKNGKLWLDNPKGVAEQLRDIATAALTVQQGLFDDESNIPLRTRAGTVYDEVYDLGEQYKRGERFASDAKLKELNDVKEHARAVVDGFNALNLTPSPAKPKAPTPPKGDDEPPAPAKPKAAASSKGVTAEEMKSLLDEALKPTIKQVANHEQQLGWLGLSGVNKFASGSWSESVERRFDEIHTHLGRKVDDEGNVTFVQRLSKLVLAPALIALAAALVLGYLIAGSIWGQGSMPATVGVVAVAAIITIAVLLVSNSGGKTTDASSSTERSKA